MVPPNSTKVSPPRCPFPDILFSPLTPSVQPSPRSTQFCYSTCTSAPLLRAPLLAAPHTLPRSCPSHWAGSRRQQLQFSSPACRGNLSWFVLAHASGLTCAPNWVVPKKSKQMIPRREGDFTLCTLGEEAPGRRTSWKTQLPWPQKLLLKLRFPWESCPTPGVMSSKGSARQALHINPLCSAHLWDHPSSNPPHTLGAKINSWGRKKRVWSYPFTFLLCPSLPKQMYLLHGPHLQTFCFFERFSYSETASLNFA